MLLLANYKKKNVILIDLFVLYLCNATKFRCMYDDGYGLCTDLFRKCL